MNVEIGMKAPELYKKIFSKVGATHITASVIVPGHKSREEDNITNIEDIGERINKMLTHDTSDEFKEANIYSFQEFSELLNRHNNDSDKIVNVYGRYRSENNKGPYKIRALHMMDFSIKKSKSNLKFIKEALDNMIGFRDSGVILDSGRSYHFVGTCPNSIAIDEVFLKQCLLLAPHIDTHYIGHKLISGIGGTLRATMGKYKYKTPEVVEILKPKIG